MAMNEPHFKRLYLTREAENLPAVRRALNRLEFLPRHFVDSPEAIPPEHQNQDTLFVTTFRGETVGKCPGSRGHLCCNYVTVDLYLGCSLGCTYCVMKSYLNFSPITVYADPFPSLARIRALSSRFPDRMLRIGTGETGDSLLLDPLFELSRHLIEGVSDLPNVFLELKTKTANVEHLLCIEKKGNAVIAFSLNAPKVQGEEEGASAPIEERIEAAKIAANAGFGLAFHFDPIIRFPGWQEEYEGVIRLIGALPVEKIRWISLGTLRFTASLRSRIEDRPFLYDEFVLCKDGKYRYPQPLRVQIYRWFLSRLASLTLAPVYLCMESVAVWKAVYGNLPMKISSIRDIFKLGSFRNFR